LSLPGFRNELDAYNPLVPDGSNWKATFMIEYEDAGERQAALERLSGIEDRVWLQIAGNERIYAIADEDIERERDGKTSAVHFCAMKSRRWQARPCTRAPASPWVSIIRTA